MKGKLYIVGAGPGDPDLLTIKALKVLQSAEVVLYDALVAPEILQHLPASCLKVYVGKRAGNHSKQQEEILEMILHYSKFYKKTVRLKGGDPYVFGRGHEELQFAVQNGIVVEVVPGISSATSVPLSAGIPLTKRGINESFWVLTGTLKNEELSKDLKLAASSGATVVILMGMKKLSAIIEVFKAIRGEKEPAAIIENGTKTNQKCLTGTLENIVEKQIEEGLSSPAIILIGKVVEERLKWQGILFSNLESIR
ncbi:MAG: uroporphyrinogen-III C-methyltransferase [Cyclobacteriaceae bacterium]